MTCPTCLGETVYDGNPYRPFCSQRCKLIDLGKWASENFRIPVGPGSSAEAELPESGDE